jgi:alpha-mannosidase
LFIAEVPPLGYATYWAYLNGERKHFNTGLHVGYYEISNEFITVRFDEITGNISSFIDRKTGQEYIKDYAGKTIAVNDAAQDTWSHSVFTFDKICGEFADPAFEIIESGSAKAALRITQKYETSEIRQDYVLYPHSKNLEVDVRIINNSKLEIFKLCFKLNSDKQTRAVYEIPFAHIKKESNGEEEPAQNFACVEDGDIGLAVINKGKYSYSVKDGEIRFIAARSCVFADHYGVHSGMRDGKYEYQDQGNLYFKYALCGYTGKFEDNASEIIKSGWELNTPVNYIAETYHKGELSQKFSAIDINQDNIILSSAKNAEDDDGTVLRFVETSGKNTQADIKYFDAELKLSFTPFEIKTIKIKDGAYSEIKLTELE